MNYGNLQKDSNRISTEIKKDLEEKGITAEEGKTQKEIISGISGGNKNH